MNKSIFILGLLCCLLFCSNILMGQHAVYLFVEINLAKTEIDLKVYDFRDSLLLKSNQSFMAICIPDKKITNEVLTLVINDTQSAIFLDADTVKLQINQDNKDSITKFIFANSPVNITYQKDRERRKAEAKKAMSIFYAARRETNKEIQKQLFAEYTSLREKEKYVSYHFFKNSKNSLIKCYYLYRQLSARRFSFAELKQFYQTIDLKKAKKYTLYQLCKQKIKTNIYKINDKINHHILTNFEGELLDIQSILSHKPTYLLIWSANCMQSVKEFEKIRNYEIDNGSQPFELLTLAQNTDYATWKMYVKTAQTNQNHYLSIQQEDNLFYQLWQNATPQGYFIKNKRLKRKDISFSDFLTENK